MQILLQKLLDGFEVEVQGLVGEVILFERECFCFHLDLQGHLCVVKEPVLREETDVIVALDISKVSTHVKLVLILASKLEQHLLLSKESVLILEILSLVYLGLLIHVNVAFKHISDIVVGLSRDFIVIIAFGFQRDEA